LSEPARQERPAGRLADVDQLTKAKTPRGRAWRLGGGFETKERPTHVPPSGPRRRMMAVILDLDRPYLFAYR
jgi:hypothetical protein